jgi:hypothetical protein
VLVLVLVSLLEVGGVVRVRDSKKVTTRPSRAKTALRGLCKTLNVCWNNGRASVGLSSTAVLSNGRRTSALRDLVPALEDVLQDPMLHETSTKDHKLHDRWIGDQLRQCCRRPGLGRTLPPMLHAHHLRPLLPHVMRTIYRPCPGLFTTSPVSPLQRHQCSTSVRMPRLSTQRTDPPATLAHYNRGNTCVYIFNKWQ